MFRILGGKTVRGNTKILPEQFLTVTEGMMAEMTLIDLTGVVVAYCVFGVWGLRLSRRIRGPVSTLKWVMLVSFTFLGTYFVLGPSGPIGFQYSLSVFMSSSVQATGVGLIIGLAAREIRARVETLAGKLSGDNPTRRSKS